MVDPAIEAFFNGKKEAWLKNNFKAFLEESEVREKQLECEQLFSKEIWLPRAAKKAGSRAFATHPSKYSHPSTGIGKKNLKNKTYVSPIIVKAENAADGFLRSGNVETELDSLGDAAALDVDNFLKLQMADGKTVLEHIKSETDLSKIILNIQSESYDSLREGFLKITKTASEVATSSKIKQVYFPVSEEYHQLSLLSNSGIIFELKGRIDNMRFSEKVKELRKVKLNNAYSAVEFTEIYNLTTIGYGGAQPQNISVLNTQNRGRAHLLMSVPPNIQKRDLNFPKQNFFNESFRYYEYREIFDTLHKLFKTDYNNVRIREGRDYWLQDLMDRIIDKMWAVRAVCKKQYRAEASQLKHHQMIWLCEGFQNAREEENDWLEKLCKEIGSWVIQTYEKLLGKRAYKLGELEWLHVNEIVVKNREALR
jgi:CRISPR-associated protein Csy1